MVNGIKIRGKNYVFVVKYGYVIIKLKLVKLILIWELSDF